MISIKMITKWHNSIKLYVELQFFCFCTLSNHVLPLYRVLRKSLERVQTSGAERLYDGQTDTYTQSQRWTSIQL